MSELYHEGIENKECPVCFENLSPICNPVLTPCLHLFCHNCLADSLKISKGDCPSCREPVSEELLIYVCEEKTKENMKDNYESTNMLSSLQECFRSSSKVDWLLGCTRQVLSSGDEKMIIFSQWTYMLGDIRIYTNFILVIYTYI